MAAVLELSTPWRVRVIQVKVPVGFYLGAAVCPRGLGGCGSQGVGSMVWGGFAEVLRYLLLVVFALQFWEVICIDEVCIETSQ